MKKRINTQFIFLVFAAISITLVLTVGVFYELFQKEVLEELKYTIWINQHDDGYLDEQIDIYELTEWIDNKINKLKK